MRVNIDVETLVALIGAKDAGEAARAISLLGADLGSPAIVEIAVRVKSQGPSSVGYGRSKAARDIAALLTSGETE